MTALPKISCNGCFFKPIIGTTSVAYSISTPIEEHECLVQKGLYVETERRWTYEKPETVDPRTHFPIKNELSNISRAVDRYIVSFIIGVLSSGVGAYFFIKRNFKVGGVSLAIAGISVIAFVYFSKQVKKASFDAANKILSTLQKSDTLLYKRSDYGLPN